MIFTLEKATIRPTRWILRLADRCLSSLYSDSNFDPTPPHQRHPWGPSERDPCSWSPKMWLLARPAVQPGPLQETWPAVRRLRRSSYCCSIDAAPLDPAPSRAVPGPASIALGRVTVRQPGVHPYQNELMEGQIASVKPPHRPTTPKLPRP